MQVVRVIPIARGIFRSELSYFSKEKISRGSLVFVPVKNRDVPALVLDCQEATTLKATLKDADFRLKKIARISARNFLFDRFIEAATKTAVFHLAAPGQILKISIPQAVLARPADIIAGPKPTPIASTRLTPEKLVIQDSEQERLAAYRGLVREGFARNHSIFLLLPTVLEVETVGEKLGKGIVEHTLSLHGELSDREQLKRWNQAVRNPHPIVVVATPLFLSLPRPDFKIFILERENSDQYKSPTRPGADARILVENLAAETGAKLVLGDLLLRTETTQRIKDHVLTPLYPLKHRLAKLGAARIEELTSSSPTDESFLRRLDPILEEKEKIFLFSHHRGLAPQTICQDCGRILACKRCRGTLTLHFARDEGQEERIFLCHHCGEVLSARIKCPDCGSWRLKELGAGSEKISALIRERSPQTKVFELTSDRVKTPVRARHLIKEFTNSPAGVLVGTEMALSYLKSKVETALVFAADALLAFPDFRGREKAFNLLLQIRSLATKNFLIFARQPNNPLFREALSGSFGDFYEKELDDRKKFGYPPFRLLVKISRQGIEPTTKKLITDLANRLKEYEPFVFPALRSESHNHYKLNLLLKLSPGSWPNSNLYNILQSLTPNFLVEIDPQNPLD